MSMPRAHPAPLPRGEGERFTSLDNFSSLIAITDSVSLTLRGTTTPRIAWLKTRRTIPPLPGERGGVRADVSLISRPNLYDHRTASCPNSQQIHSRGTVHNNFSSCSCICWCCGLGQAALQMRRSLFWTNPFARRKIKSMKKDRRSRLCGTLAGVG